MITDILFSYRLDDIASEFTYSSLDEHLCSPDNCYILGDYFVCELEYLIFEYLDPIDDYKSLILVNKYYKEMIQKDDTFLKLKKIYELIKCYCLDTKKEIGSFEKYIKFGTFQCHSHGCYENYECTIKFCGIGTPDYVFFRPCHDKYCRYLIACMFGWLKIIKYLSLRINRLRMTANDFIWEVDSTNFDFKMVCFFGYLEIAKWMYDTRKETLSSVKLSFDNDNALFIACTNDQLEMAKWLCTLEPKYKIHEKKGELVCWWIGK